MVKTQAVEGALRKTAVLTTEQKAVLDDRMEELKKHSAMEPFYVRHKNALIFSSVTLAGGIVLFGIYKYFNAWFTKKMLVGVAFVYLSYICVFYGSSYLYNKRLVKIMQELSLTEVWKKERMKEFTSSHILKRLYLLYTLYKAKDEELIEGEVVINNNKSKE